MTPMTLILPLSQTALHLCMEMSLMPKTGMPGHGNMPGANAIFKVMLVPSTFEREAGKTLIHIILHAYLHTCMASTEYLNEGSWESM